MSSVSRIRSSTSSGKNEDVVEHHRRAGRSFTADGVCSFVREEGSGLPVLFMHGMLGTSFLYRKLIHEVAQRGMRGVAFDLPGFGLAERPNDYDYSWTGLGAFSVAAVEELGLKHFHLVVHDIGGPVGFELASKVPDRIASLTIFNTVIDAASWSPPWSMQPFRYRGIGELWLKGLNGPLFRALMRLQGISDMSAVTAADLNAYLKLMRGDDGGRAFLRVMRSGETTQEKEALYHSTVRDVAYPVQVVWAADDPAMKLSVYGEKARQAVGLAKIELIPGKHFPQEDQPAAMADHIARIAG